MAAGVPPPADVPDHAHFGRYGPHFRLLEPALAPTRRDENRWAEVRAVVDAGLEALRAGVAREYGWDVG